MTLTSLRTGFELTEGIAGLKGAADVFTGTEARADKTHHLDMESGGMDTSNKAL
jgi:hypothetical protein